MEKINAELGKVVCDELAFNDAVDYIDKRTLQDSIKQMR
jgi:hypothetical protein